MTFTIPAEVHTDDHIISVDFDAEKWFEQATDDEIIDLIQCGFGGDYPADEVARRSSEWFPEIDKVFDHRNPNEDLSGFECSVFESAAIKWLTTNRPDLANAI